MRGFPTPLPLPRRPWQTLVGRLAVLTVVGATAVALTRELAGDGRTPLLEIALLLPFSGPAVALAAAAAWGLRRRRLAVVATVVALVHLVMLAPAMGFGVRRPASTAGAQDLTVMTFNTLTGFADPAAIVDLVRQRRVDVLALEETTPVIAVALRRNGLTELLPHEAGSTGWGAGGTTLWSRLPLQYVGEVPGTTFALPQRAVRLPDGTRVLFTAVHTLSPIPGRVPVWRADLAAIGTAVRAQTGPQVVLGDFNATRDHPGFRRLLTGPDALTDAAESVGLLGGAWPGFTWPANKPVPPFMRLDHVLVTPSRVAVRSLDVVRLPGSDHLALVAHLAVTPGP